MMVITWKQNYCSLILVSLHALILSCFHFIFYLSKNKIWSSKLSNEDFCAGVIILIVISVGWSVRFMLGPSLFGKKVQIHINIPNESDDKFDRKHYNVLSWKYEDENKSDDTAAYADILLCSSGSFHYYFHVDE